VQRRDFLLETFAHALGATMAAAFVYVVGALGDVFTFSWVSFGVALMVLGIAVGLFGYGLVAGASRAQPWRQNKGSRGSPRV
jgi:hypothetical protein